MSPRCRQPRIDSSARVLGLVAVALAVATALYAPRARAQQTGQTLTGQVVDADARRPIADARVRTLGTSRADTRETATDADGMFHLRGLTAPQGTIEVSRLGYEPARAAYDLADTSTLTLIIRLTPHALPLAPIEVSTTRAVERESPVPFTELPREETLARYWAQDPPMLLAETPGVYASSDAGNVVGYSCIESDGYWEQSWSRLWAYEFTAARLDPRMTTRLNFYGGPEQLHLAYYAVDRSYLDGRYTGDPDRDRRFNPLNWRNETDNFFEPHYELIQDIRLNDRASLTSSAFYFPGSGYYDDLPYGPQSFASRQLPSFYVPSDSLYPAAYYQTDSTGAPELPPNGRFLVTGSDITQRPWVRNHHYR